MDKIVKYVERFPGLSIFEIAEAMGLTAKEISFPMSHLVRHGKLYKRTTPQKVEYHTYGVDNVKTN